MPVDPILPVFRAAAIHLTVTPATLRRAEALGWTPGECDVLLWALGEVDRQQQASNSHRAALASLVEAVADEGPITATVAPAWNRACAVLSAGWSVGRDPSICGVVVRERTSDGITSRTLCPLQPGHDGDHAEALAGDDTDTDTDRSAPS